MLSTFSSKMSLNYIQDRTSRLSKIKMHDIKKLDSDGVVSNRYTMIWFHTNPMFVEGFSWDDIILNSFKRWRFCHFCIAELAVIADNLEAENKGKSLQCNRRRGGDGESLRTETQQLRGATGSARRCNRGTQLVSRYLSAAYCAG